MPYIGQIPTGLYTTTNAKDTFSGDASATSFTLSQAGTTNNVDVFVENVRQEPTVAYVVDGNTLTFTAPPVSGTDNIYVVNRGPAELSASHPASQALEAYSGTFTTDVSVGGNLVTTGTITLTANNPIGLGNVSLGSASLSSNVSGGGNTAIGTDTLEDVTNQFNNTAIGYQAGKDSTGSGNTFVGNWSGVQMTTGSNNTILGRFSGVDGSLDIRTSNSHIVLSDGNGAARAWINPTGNLVFPNGKGIDFSASAGGSASSSILDDYEEGTWTPVYSSTFTEGCFDNGTGFATAIGRYTKIGQLVWCYAEVTVSGATSNVTIGANYSVNYSSLPFLPVSSGASFNVLHGTAMIYGTIGSGLIGTASITPLDTQYVFVVTYTGVSGAFAGTTPQSIAFCYHTAS
jgi:hypothetical protein